MRRWVPKLQSVVLRHLAPAVLAIPLAFPIATGALAQSGTPAPQDQQGKNAPDSKSADAVKDNERKAAEFVEAQQAINGPAGNPECVWLGRRVVRLMWLDDLDTAFRHLDLYDRFGGVEGAAYLIGGLGVNFQKKDDIVLAPIRTGVGARLGANVGYLKYSPKPRWNPF